MTETTPVKVPPVSLAISGQVGITYTDSRDGEKMDGYLFFGMITSCTENALYALQELNHPNLDICHHISPKQWDDAVKFNDVECTEIAGSHPEQLYHWKFY